VKFWPRALFKMYKCCELAFEDKEEYLVHFELEHDCESTMSRIKCGSVGCCWTFTDPEILKKHVLNHRDVFDHMRYIRQLEERHGRILESQSEEVAHQLSTLYAKPSVTSELVQRTVQMSQNLANCSAQIEQRNSIFKIIAEYSISTKDLRNVALALHKLSHPFSGFETEEKRMAWFENANTLIPFHDYDMGTICAQSCDFNLWRSLQKFLNKPGMPDTVKKYMAECEETRDGSFRSILQGELWQRKKALFPPGKLMIPLTLYCGDFPIMDSDEKVGAIYINMPALPRKMQPLFDFVFLSSLHFSADRKQLDPASYLDSTLHKLKNLEYEGLSLNFDTGYEQVYFCLTHVQAEDYVLDELLGRTTTNECRFCKADEHQRKTMVKDDGDLIRTEATTSFFDVYRLPFNSTEDWYLDVLTDFLVRVCKVDLVYILTDLIFVQNIISVDDLNRRMLYFNYPVKDKRNMPSEFSADDLKNGQIKMEADQILCFVRNLPMMVGNLIYLREGDEEEKQLLSWTLFMAMRNILYFLLAKTMAPGAEVELRHLVDTHHTLFKQFAPHNGTLPLEFHNAIHYWRIVQKLGPPAVQETRPKVSSEHCGGIADKVDLLGAIAWKQQMIMNEKLLLKNYTIEDNFKAPTFQTNVQLHVMREFSMLGPADGLKSVRRLICFNEMFKIGSVVVLGMDEGGRPTFGKIEHIILVQGGAEGAFKLLCAKLENNFHDERFGAYSLSESKPKVRLVVDRDDIMWRRCFNLHKINNEIYVSLHAEIHF
jgi:hypothetical protein